MTEGRDWHSEWARVARCLFCGAVGAWFSCHCEWVQRIRAGKFPVPRTVVRNGVLVIECCEELREAARRAGVIRVSTPSTGTVRVDGDIQSEAVPASTERSGVDDSDMQVSTDVDGDGECVDAVDGGDEPYVDGESELDRARRLRRERQQRWRARK